MTTPMPDAPPQFDPLAPLSTAPSGANQDPTATLEEVLATQLGLAKRLQQRLINEEYLEPRDYKDLVSTANNILALAHRTEEATRIIGTYKLFVSTVTEFLRNRSDTIGEDLIEELLKTAKNLGTDGTIGPMLR